MIGLVIVLLVLLVFLGPALLLGPRMIRGRATDTVAAQIRSLTPEEYPLELRHKKDALAVEIRALGFMDWGLAQASNVPAAPTLAAWHREDEPTFAVLAYAHRGPKASGLFTLAFTTRMASGLQVVTRNAATPQLEPIVPEWRIAHYPAAKQPGALYAIHRTRVAAQGAVAELGPWLELAVQQAETRNALYQRYVELGLFERADDDGRLRYTEAGARRMATGLLPPIRQWLQFKQWLERSSGRR